MKAQGMRSETRRSVRTGASSPAEQGYTCHNQNQAGATKSCTVELVRRSTVVNKGVAVDGAVSTLKSSSTEGSLTHQCL